MLETNNENQIIEITRGDKATIELECPGYTFKEEDFIEFRVYKKEELNNDPVLTKRVEISEECEKVYIDLTEEDTRIGEMLNEEAEYWYEIELNNNQTLIGYDRIGPKILILYPEGKK